MNKNRIVGFMAFTLMACFTQNSWAAIGRVAFASGDARIERHVGGHTVHIKAEKGTELLVGDALQTGPQSRLQWKMADDAIVAINSNSEFVIRDFNTSTAKSQGRAFYSLLKGGLRMLSGLIGKGAPDAFSLSTPTATMGIRGTILEVYIITDADGNVQTVFKTDSGRIFVESNGKITEVAAGDDPLVTEANKTPTTATQAQIDAIAALEKETEIDPGVADTKVNDGTTEGGPNADGTGGEKKPPPDGGEPPYDNNAPSNDPAPRVGDPSSPN